jgi:uncharacterized membrane protein YuzA (DUF378 family)
VISYIITGLAAVGFVAMVINELRKDNQ